MSTQRTILVIVVAAAAVIGAGLYFAPTTTKDNAAGTVAPAVRHKGEPAQSAGGQPTAPAPSAGQQSSTMQSASPPPREQLELKLSRPTGNAPKQESRPIYTPQNAPQQGARPEYKTQ